LYNFSQEIVLLHALAGPVLPIIASVLWIPHSSTQELALREVTLRGTTWMVHLLVSFCLVYHQLGSWAQNS